MAHYVEVDKHALFRFLEERGYTQAVHCNEIVYVRRSQRDKNVYVKVYTSVAAPGCVRGCGVDAIRVAAVWDNGKHSVGIGKFKRVLRTTSTESIINRVSERLREAAVRCNAWIDNPPVVS